MKKIMKSKLIAAAMSLAVAFTMIITMGTMAYADDTPDAITMGTGVLSKNVNKYNGVQRVYYGNADEDWYVIGYDGNGAVSQKDIITLLHAKVEEKTQFNTNSIGAYLNAYGWKDSDADEPKTPSNLRNFIDTRYVTGYKSDGQDIPARFSAAERSAIVPRFLEGGGTNDDESKMTGKSVENAMIWPLSIAEAKTVDYFLRSSGTIKDWWLRSPSSIGPNLAGIVNQGSAWQYSNGVTNDSGVRPAFCLNMKSVLFTSAATGGKSEFLGSLSKVGTNDSGEWKLTIKDDDHKNFVIKDKVQTAGKKEFTITYGGTPPGRDKGYISAVIKSKDDKIKYYGKIIRASGNDNANCKVDIDGIAMEGGDMLCVFNEQCRGDNKTDLASELVEVYTEPMPPTITAQPKDLELTYGDTTGNKLEVAAKGEEGCTLSYQWYRRDAQDAQAVILENETNDSYTVPADQNVDTTKYYFCEVTKTRTSDGAKAIKTSDQAAVTVNKAKLTIRPKDQSFIYNGQSQGPADVIYAGTQVDEYVTYDKLKYNDYLSNITVDGQGDKAGTYDLEPSAVNIQDGKNNQVNGNYDIKLEKGDLIIEKAKVTITADDKSSKKGEALAPLTYKISGGYAQSDDLGITVSTDANKDKEGTYPIKVAWNNNNNYDATLVNGKYTVIGEPTPKVSGTPFARITAGKKSLTIGWNKIEGAAGYDIFFAKCNHKDKKDTCKNVKMIKGNKRFSWKKTGLKKGTAYKVYVKAFIYKDGKKQYFYESPLIHAYAGNGNKKYTNAKSVKIKNVKKGKLTLKKGKAFKIKAKVKKVKKNKKLFPKGHVPTLRYMTSDKKIATVSSNGRIKAKAKGKCCVYAYAHNGVSKKVIVIVK